MGDAQATNKATAIRLFTEVFGGHDVDAADAYLAAGVVFHNGGKQLRGPEGWKVFAKDWIEGFPDTQMVVDFAMAEDDRVLIHWRAEGTHRGEFFGRSPTGRRLTVSGLTLFRFSSGKIEEMWDQTEAFGEVEAFTIT